MRTKLMAVCAAIAVAGMTHAASPTATQAWTTNYVAKAVASVVCVRSNATDAVYYYAWNAMMRVEYASVYALMATNATAAATAYGVTNGMYFVWNEPMHSYTNRTQTITATPTNLVWRGVQSYGNVFSNRFDVVRRYLQPSYAKEVTK